MGNPYIGLAAVTGVVALAPLVTGLMPPKWRIPQVVLLLVGGVLIGPEMLGWAQPDDVTVLSEMGMGFLFMLAGYELDPALMRSRAGTIAIRSWLSSALLGIGLVLGAEQLFTVGSPIETVIALTTTALGTLLPIMRENKLTGTPLGTQVMATGAVGELGPVIAMALLLGSRRSLAEALLLVALVGLALALIYLPSRVRWQAAADIVTRGEDETTQTTLRITVALLVTLLAVSVGFGFDSVLGAFVAGMILRQWSPGGMVALESKLDAVGWGVFIPIFFVHSGLGLDIDSIVADPLLPVVMLVAMLIIRGGPVLWWYRGELPTVPRRQLALMSATTLPLVVALTEVATAAGTMPESRAAAAIGAGVLSVLILPKAAMMLGAREPVSPARS